MLWLKNALTERDGKTFDLKRIAGAASLIGFHINETYAVFFQHAPFDMMAYAAATAAMIAALGAAIALGVKGEAAS